MSVLNTKVYIGNLPGANVDECFFKEFIYESCPTPPTQFKFIRDLNRYQTC